MDNLYVLRKKLQEIYARHSIVFDKAAQFILAIAVFYFINDNIGFMKVLARPVVTLALAVICTVFPLIITVIGAICLVLCHMYAASLGILLVTGVIFLVMFVFYFRFTPKKSLAVLLTPLAFVLNIPYVIPVAFAMVSGPVTVIAIVFGTIVFYMMQYVKKATPTLQGEESAGLVMQMTAYIKQVFLNKQMWVVVFAFIICFFVVYVIRRQAIDYAWKAAIAAGTVVNVVVIAGGNIILGEHTAYGTLIIGSILSVLVGFVLEFFLFSVDYAKSEKLQFEDDEYYYYVKAVPKVTVSTSEKTIKRINERQEPEVEEPDNDVTDEVIIKKKISSRRPTPVKGPVTKKHDIDEVNKVLLARSLKKELGMKK